jgi:hypothetical protein
VLPHTPVEVIAETDTMCTSPHNSVSMLLAPKENPTMAVGATSKHAASHTSSQLGSNIKPHLLLLLYNRALQVSHAIRDALMVRAADFGIVLEDIAITHLSFGTEFTKAVEMKQVAEQDAERARFVVLKAEQVRAFLLDLHSASMHVECCGQLICNTPAARARMLRGAPGRAGACQLCWALRRAVETGMVVCVAHDVMHEAGSRAGHRARTLRGAQGRAGARETFREDGNALPCMYARAHTARHD